MVTKFVVKCSELKAHVVLFRLCRILFYLRLIEDWATAIEFLFLK